MAQDPTDSRPSQRYRFGVFDADTATGELRRQGIRIKLNAQPFLVLLLLLGRAGQLLTREEIARQLWPDGTFVDYEHGVNSAVNRIREALGDTAGSPRFVETLVRRGYRFVAPVERIAAEPTAAEPIPSPAAEPINRTVILSEGVADAESKDLRLSSADELPLLSRILASPEELPKTSYAVVQTLFVLL